MESQNRKTDIHSAWGLGKMMHVVMALRAAIELNVFDIIASSGPNAQLSCDQILSKIPTKNPNASSTFGRILRMLGVHSMLTMTTRQCENDNNKTETAYGLTRETDCLVTDANGVSGCSLVLFHTDKDYTNCLYMLKDVVLNTGNLPVYNAYYGRALFDDLAKKPEIMNEFNKMLTFVTIDIIEHVLKDYKGFEGVTELMDVGGNIGVTIQMIVSRYPNIRGINFDMPSIIAKAPNYPGVEHIGGDMIKSLPKAQTIFLKSVLHDWNDDICTQILSNCWAALPDEGKVIAVEFVIPQVLGTDIESANIVAMDFNVLCSHDGKERTLMEFEALAKIVGFKETKAFPVGQGFHVIEFIKTSAI